MSIHIAGWAVSTFLVSQAPSACFASLNVPQGSIYTESLNLSTPSQIGTHLTGYPKYPVDAAMVGSSVCIACFRDWKKWSSALTSYIGHLLCPLCSREEIRWHKLGGGEHSEGWCKSQRGYQWGVAPGVHERQNLETCHVHIPNATNLAAFILIVASGVFRWEIFISLVGLSARKFCIVLCTYWITSHFASLILLLQ